MDLKLDHFNHVYKNIHLKQFNENTILVTSHPLKYAYNIMVNKGDLKNNDPSLVKLVERCVHMFKNTTIQVASQK